APWSGYRPPPLDGPRVLDLVRTLADRRYASAVVFTAVHQSPLPAATLLTLARLEDVAAVREDYPGSLLEVRRARRDGLPEEEAALVLAWAAGSGAPPDGDRLRERRPLPDVCALVSAGPYVVVRPGASVPARAPDPDHARDVVAALAAAG